MKRERGFTAIEIIVSAFITALIALGAGMTTVQILRVTAQNDDWATATRYAQNVGYWVSEDAMMAETIVNGTGNELITMTWRRWETGNSYNVTYIKVNPSDTIFEIERRCEVRDLNRNQIQNTTAYIANNISDFQYVSSGEYGKLTVTASADSRSVVREYQINPRVAY